jgi:hypothetical protein
MKIGTSGQCTGDGPRPIMVWNDAQGMRITTRGGDAPGALLHIIAPHYRCLGRRIVRMWHTIYCDLVMRYAGRTIRKGRGDLAQGHAWENGLAKISPRQGLWGLQACDCQKRLEE